ncbi:Enhancer of decapping 3 [Carabus blaptoides fortunei]
MVSVSCKNERGTYQGQISAVTGTTITLIKPFHNGVPHHEPEVKLNSLDIEDLQLIDSKPNITNGQSIVTVAKPVAKRAGRSVSISECTALTHKPIDTESSSTSAVAIIMKSFGGGASISEHANTMYKNGTPNKKDKFKMKWKDEACFGMSMDQQSMLQDFDFEKNLALFNKEAVWEEINASQRPDVVHQTDQCRRQQVQKYRHDENVIATLPTAFRQIVVPAPDSSEYVTDDGLVVPSVTHELRRQLYAAAERRGLSEERQTELMGRAATEMALQLLGGGHRLNPHNTHQWPTVVVLCGGHRQGAIGVNTARQLAGHGVNTVVYTSVPSPEQHTALRTEYNLYKHTKNKCTHIVSGLPQTADLIIVAVYSSEENEPCNNTSVVHQQLIDWTNQNRAPVLALDPPSHGTPGIHTKFSLLSMLPLAHSPENGKLYLCNLGYPLKVYKDVGIKYRSPFGPKFVIPLHPNDT